ncbi:MAG: hypothetical protein QXP01_00245 [Candidatus Hadarchaeum sp.]
MKKERGAERVGAVLRALNRDHGDIAERLGQLFEGFVVSTKKPGVRTRRGLCMVALPTREQGDLFALELRILPVWKDDTIVLEGCQVRLVQPDGSVVAVQRMDSKGGLVFHRVPAGEYRLALPEVLSTAYCPRDSALIAVLADLLIHEQRNDLVAHLNVCSRCRKRLDALHEAMRVRPIVPLAELTAAAQQGAPKARQEVDCTQAWLQRLTERGAGATESRVVRVKGAVRTRGAMPVLGAVPTTPVGELHAPVVDEAGNPTVRRIPLVLAGGPRIDRQGLFTCILSTKDLSIEGYWVRLSIADRHRQLALGEEPLVREPSEQLLRAVFNIDVSKLGVRDVTIPSKALELTVSPR